MSALAAVGLLATGAVIGGVLAVVGIYAAFVFMELRTMRP